MIRSEVRHRNDEEEVSRSRVILRLAKHAEAPLSRKKVLPRIACALCKPSASNVTDGTQGNLVTIVRSFAVCAAQDDRH
jgi:hypothetical protein